MPDDPSTAPTVPTIRTCLVGLGTIGRTHVAAMPAHPGLVLTTVVDPVADPADVPDGVRLARDLDEVMGDVDLVVIATPSDTHADHDLPARRASLASSWLDSGVNQLSVVSRFVDIDGLTALDHADEGVASATRLGRTDGAAEALLLTDWRSAGSSKQTTLAWPAEDRRVLLDHTAMAATVIDGGRVIDAFRVADGTPRAIAHYRGLYGTLAETPDHDDLGLATAVRIMRVLHA